MTKRVESPSIFVRSRETGVCHVAHPDRRAGGEHGGRVQGTDTSTEPCNAMVLNYTIISAGKICVVGRAGLGIGGPWGRANRDTPAERTSPWSVPKIKTLTCTKTASK